MIYQVITFNVLPALEVNCLSRLLSDISTSRQLLSVKDQPTRDDDALPTAAINDSITKDDQDKARSVTHGGITRGFHKNSRIAMHVLASCYCFLMLAVICDEYFIGSIEVLCQSECEVVFSFSIIFKSFALCRIKHAARCCWSYLYGNGNIVAGTLHQLRQHVHH